MTDVMRAALHGQFLAALDMIGNAIEVCPESLWGDPSAEPQFWYITHHTLFWTDYYLSDSVEGYAPPPPFGLEEMDPAGVLPPRVSTRVELQAWLKQCPDKASASIGRLDDGNARALAGALDHQLDRLELLLYNLRHVQHHAAQLNLLLRLRSDVIPPRWVRRGLASGEA